MKLLVILSVSFFLVSDCIGQITLGSGRTLYSKIDSIYISRLQSGLKITTDSVNRLRGKVKIITASLAKQEAALAKKDTVWFSGFGGYGSKFAPFNQTAVKNEITVLKKNIADLKTALAVIRTNQSTMTSEINLLKKSVTEIKTALVLIRQDIVDIKAKLPN